MKKRKMCAHGKIRNAKYNKRANRWHQKQPNFAVTAKYIREFFAPRLRQKRRMYLYLERIGKV